MEHFVAVLCLVLFLRGQLREAAVDRKWIMVPQEFDEGLHAEFDIVEQVIFRA